MESLLQLLTELLLLTLFSSLWVAAWLGWIFRGEIRHFLFSYVFPAYWRAGRDVDDVSTMSQEQFDLYLAAEADAPAFVRGVLGCPRCLSAYVAAVGSFIAVAAFIAFHLSGLDEWTLAAVLSPPLCLVVVMAPLIWAASAWGGFKLHQKL